MFNERRNGKINPRKDSAGLAKFTAILRASSICLNSSIILEYRGNFRPASSREEKVSKLLAAVTMFCLITFSGSNFAQAASCAEKCAAGCGGKGAACMSNCSNRCEHGGAKGKY
jgi:hypothetical protein